MNHRSPRSARLHKIYRLLDFSLLDLLALSLLFSLLVPVLLLLLFDPFTFLSALSASCRCCFRVGKVWLANFFTSGSLALSDSRWNLLTDRKITRLNSSHRTISYAVFCLKKKKK